MISSNYMEILSTGREILSKPRKSHRQTHYELGMAFRRLLICALRVLDGDGRDFVRTVCSSHYFVHFVAFIIDCVI